ncbi:ABC transporter substrate-binding protein [Agrococcus casei]|uniref:ABC transporter substrate-binding protein n=1 Tax=Agrococcus casei TaxID=343512 RepID=UPI003F90F2D8
MKHKTLWKVAAVAAALGLTVAASGCSSDGGDGGDGLGTLNVGQISDSIAFFPLYVAEENGYFEDEGLTLGERPRLGTGAKLAAALQSGSVDVGAGVISDVFNLAASDDSARLTGSLVTEYYVDIIVADGFDGPGADAPLEEKIEALVGKNIGITGPGSGTEALVKYLFGLVDADPSSDATLVNLGAVPSGAIGAMSAGQVDALAFFQPVGQIAEAQGVGEIYISPQRGDVPDMAGALHGVLFSTTGAIEGKTAEIEAFNRGIDAALKFIADDPDAAAEMLAAYLGDTDPAVVEALVQILPDEMSSGVAVTTDSYETALGFHVDSGLIATNPAYGDLVWEEAQE